MRFLLVLLVACVACKKASKESAPATVDDFGKDGAKGGSGPGRPDPTGTMAPGADAGVAGGRQRGGTLEFLDGDLEIAAGAIDKDVVRKVVKGNTTKLQYCYEKTLLGNPTIEGKVVATFTIAAEGHVSDVKTSGVHPDVETCVAEIVKAFKFPPSGKKVDVSYPFTFKPA